MRHSAEQFIRKMFFAAFIFLLVRGQFAFISTSCVEINQCEPLINLLKATGITKEVKEYLDSINCGFTINSPKIWCKNDFRSCVTPDGQEGACIQYNKCQVYLDKLTDLNSEDEETAAYLKDYGCNYVFESGVNVCCPQASPDTNVLAVNPPDFEPPITINQNIAPFTSPDLSTSTMKPDLSKRSNIKQPLKTEKCGKRTESNKIVGGEITAIDEFPWVVLLRYKSSNGYEYKCQGVLIHRKYVLTAAHCVENSSTLDSVVLGEYDTRNDTDCVYYDNIPDCAEPLQIIKVEEVVTYKRNVSFYDDIALIRLQEEAVFSDFVQQICLPPTLSERKFLFLTVAGWGQSEDEIRSSIKRKVDLQVVSNDMCTKVYKYNLKEDQLCLGSSLKDTCTGDSGSPVMQLLKIGDQLIWHVVGIVSIGFNNPCGKHPGVYTYVPPYLKWIEENINP